MVSPFDIRTLAFPTLADRSSPEDVLSAVQILRNAASRDGHAPRNRFRESARPEFQRSALTGGSRLSRVLATLDAIVQQNPASALATMLPGPIGAVAGLGALQEGGKPGDLLRELARATTREGTALTSRQGGSAPTSVEREFRDRAEREDREANRALREGRGSGASPRRGNVSNAGR